MDELVFLMVKYPPMTVVFWGISMNFRKLFTAPVKTQNEYADRILSEKISLKEVLDTAYFFFALIMTSPWFVMDAKGQLRSRRVFCRKGKIPAAMRWGQLPQNWF